MLELVDGELQRVVNTLGLRYPVMVRVVPQYVMDAMAALGSGLSLDELAVGRTYGGSTFADGMHLVFLSEEQRDPHQAALTVLHELRHAWQFEQDEQNDYRRQNETVGYLDNTYEQDAEAWAHSYVTRFRVVREV